MYRNIGIFLCVVLQYVSIETCLAESVIPLSGADWRIHEDADGQGIQRKMFEADPSGAGWIPATVPGNIQSDLEAGHRLNPLWYGAGDPRLADVAKKDWWYRCDFVIPSSMKGRRLKLVFDGVDHECEVWLNGHRLGNHAGMFKRFGFDVAAFAKLGEANQLAVRISRIPEPVIAWVTDSEALGGIKVNENNNYIRGMLKDLKSPTNCAWDWGVAIYTLGIWKDVRLEASGAARIEWTRVQSNLRPDHSQATVKVKLEVDALAAVNTTARLAILGYGATAASVVEASLNAGTNMIEAELPLERPALWWPNGQGEQPLYQLKVVLEDSATGRVLDTREVRFGVREIRWDQTPGTPPDFINPLKLVVNGRPVRQMGSNLIPPDCLFGRMEQRGMRLLDLAHAAGINCLRLWGGGVTLSEAMYDRADELGIMLIQEFFLANCTPETDTVFLANLEATAINIVKQVRNHPSIVEWGGGNEMKWKNGTVHPALQLLEKIVREEDGGIFRASEPAQGAGIHGRFGYVNNIDPDPYLSWLGGGGRNFYERYNNADNIMRVGEFGTTSPANLEVWHREIPPASQWPLTNFEDPVLIRKNVFHGAWVKENWLHKELTERIFGKADGLDDLVRAGQFLGAEGLRYAMDELRRKGAALGGGFMSWNYNEPWPNGAGSYMVDYDGRPLMNYDFVCQALAPVSLTLKYDSLLYDPVKGLSVGLFLVSDAPARVENLKWSWIARDRRGEIFGSGEGIAAIDPVEVKALASLSLRPPAKTTFGPIFVELRLADANGKTLAERLHIFGADRVEDPLAGLMKNTGEDRNDELSTLTEWERMHAYKPDSPENLAFVGNGAKPAVASSSAPAMIHQAAGLNDGLWGNDHGWIGGSAGSSFQIDLGKPSTVGLFKMSRDRTGIFMDRQIGSLVIEGSLDGQHWQMLCNRSEIKSIPNFRTTDPLRIDIVPVKVQHIRVTVNAKKAKKAKKATDDIPFLDEFEVYAPDPDAPKELPAISRYAMKKRMPELWRPVRRTTLTVEELPPRSQSGMDVLELRVKNTGPMTALFCEPHPLIDYRTDLFIENNHCFIPPGESRVITVRVKTSSVALAGEGLGARAGRGLSLGETGWRLSCWNAEDVVIEPDKRVLLALGRRDQMCREFSGFSEKDKIKEVKQPALTGSRPDPAQLPYLLDGGKAARFEFPVSTAQAKYGAQLRIHTADQSKEVRAQIQVTVNGKLFEQSLSEGIGLQKTDPSHLAFPSTLTFEIPSSLLQSGKNIIEIRTKNDGWFSWDAMDLIGQK